MNIGDKKVLTTEEIKTLTQEQFEAYVQKEDSQTLNEILELRGNLPIFDDADELKKYAELRDQGIITEEEFQAKKKQLLDL